MKIKKSRLFEIIREEIEEVRLRNNIRGAIREFVSTGTAAGAQKSGYQSDKSKTAQTQYDTKKTDYESQVKSQHKIHGQIISRFSITFLKENENWLN